MKFQYNDGGREEAGYKGSVGDCTVRAIAIATGLPYRKVYDDLFKLNKKNNARGERTSPRDGGTAMKTIKEYMAYNAFDWTPTMGIGTGTTVHLKEGELPDGKLVVRCSKHMVAVIDGVIHDIYNPSRGGTRAVYGYFRIENTDHT